jgi:hypothetical protein
MIIDCFTYYCERELLDFRLKYLSQIVDHFVIAEGLYSFSGTRREPELHVILHDNPLKHKVSVVVAENNFEGNPWDYEIKQRSSLDLYKSIITKPSDIILISDIDEIPDIRMLQRLKNLDGNKKTLFIFNQFNCFLRANNVMMYDKAKHRYFWSGTCGFYASESLGPQYARQEIRRQSNKELPKTILNSAGWHLSSIGTYDWLKIKTQETSHREDPGMGERRNRDILTDYEARINFGNPNQFFARFHPHSLFTLEFCSLLAETIGNSVFEPRIDTPIQVSNRLLDFLREPATISKGFSSPPLVDVNK